MPASFGTALMMMLLRFGPRGDDQVDESEEESDEDEEDEETGATTYSTLKNSVQDRGSEMQPHANRSQRSIARHRGSISSNF
jgi:hypothetical protein